MKAMGDHAGDTATALANLPESRAKRRSISEQRAALMVQCACELPGAATAHTGDIHLPFSVLEFEQQLRARYGTSHPELVYRTDSTLERARLERAQLKHIPRVILRQGAPRRGSER